MTTSSTPMATAVAAAVAGGSTPPAGTGANGAADGASSGGGFTALLAAALGTGDPAAVVKALQGLHRGAGAPTGDGAGESDTSDTVDDAPVAGLQQALAALLPQVSAGTTSGAGTEGVGTEAAAIVRAGAEGTLDRAALLAALRAATAAGRAAAPTTGEAAPANSAVTTPDASATTAPTPTTGTATSTSGPGQSVPVVPGSTDRAASTSPTAAPTTGRAVPVDVTAATEASAPTPLPPAGTGGGAANAAPATPAPAPTPVDGGLHARVVARVIQAAELLENAPPPRHMVVELPDSDGLRLQVAMRGSEVHVNLHGGRTAPDLGAWGRELAAGLASRGMSLGEFTSGDSAPSGREQQSDDHHPRPSEDDRPAAPPRGRPRPDDGELRL